MIGMQLFTTGQKYLFLYRLDAATTARLRRHFLSTQKALELVFAEKLPKSPIVVARLACEQTPHIPPPHGNSPKHKRGVSKAKDRAHRHIEKTRSHEILPISVAHPSSENPPLTRSHGPQMNKPQFGIIPTASNPPQHAAAMAIDPIPHHLANESPNRLETRDPIELGHSYRHFIAAFFTHISTISFKVSLPTTGSECWVFIHPANQGFEILRRQVEIEVALA